MSGGKIALIVIAAVVGLLLVVGFGLTALFSSLTEGLEGAPGGFGEQDTYGDDEYLDGLWDRCEAGDGGACDELYWESPLNSEYESFGDTCGGRYEPGTVMCETVM